MDIAQIAERFVRAQRNGPQVVISPGEASLTAEDAYGIQDRVFASLYGERPTAWKVGSSGPTAEPNAAPIPVSHVYKSPAAVDATGLHMIGVEIEIAFRLARDLAARAQPYTDDELAAAIAETLVAIEICDTRLADWQTVPPLWKLADFQLNAGLVVGTGSTRTAHIDFTTLHAELSIDGVKKKEATGAHPLGNPARLLPWLAQHTAQHGGGLRAGDVITTGSWTGMDFVVPGAEVVARFAGIGEARVMIKG